MTTTTTKKSTFRLKDINVFGLAIAITLWSTICIVGTVKAYECYTESPTTCLIKSVKA